MKPRILAQLTY